MKKFFTKFFREYQVQIFIFSLLRVFSFAQILFWPYAFSKIVNIMSENPENWRGAFIWAGVMVVNKVLEDFLRLKSKFELEKIGTKLRISLASFFSENTELRENKKTGESVQAIKKAAESIDSLIELYRTHILQLPINFIVIPIILWRASPDYLIMLTIYAALYLVLDRFLLKIYQEKLQKHFVASEIFWGTTYRKTPEVWRARENAHDFAEDLRREGDKFYEKAVSSCSMRRWRWTILQSLSSLSVGLVVLFVLFRIKNNIAPVGNIILITSYFQKMQTTLNILTSTFSEVLGAKLSLKRLGEAVKIK